MKIGSAVAGFCLLQGIAQAASASEGDQHYRFEIARAQGTIYNPWTQSDDPVELRSFKGSGANEGDFVAPTIRIAPGNSLTIEMNNRLEPCTNDQIAEKRCFNETNLHTHGLWVSPSGNSDNVMISIPPGGQFRYEYEISEDHPAGTFWYHPHRHGSGFVQVGSGMAGALIVTGSREPTATRPGDVDILLRDAKGRPFSERVLLFQQIQYGCQDAEGKIEGRMVDGEYVRPWTCAPGAIGRIESDDNDWDWVNSGRFTGINGVVQPRLAVARVGEFERWRLIHAGTRERVRMQVRRLAAEAPELRDVPAAAQEDWIARYCSGPALTLWHVAMDGLTRSSIRPADEAVLFSGDRLDVLVQFPDAGRYCLTQDATRDAADTQPPRVLAVVEATGAGVATDPRIELASTLVRAASAALARPDQREMRDIVISDLEDGLKLKSFVWHRPIPQAKVEGYREAVLSVIAPPDANQLLFHINGRTYDHDRIDHELPLGATEEWQVASLVGDHPLHIHVNPFQVAWIRDSQGRDVTDPNGPAFDTDYAGLTGEWKDTVFVKQGHRVAFRTRYERFTGDFVTHCHIMFHGDHGMMLNLRIVDKEGREAKGGSHH
jgi:L-ascorbate oxidase